MGILFPYNTKISSILKYKLVTQDKQHSIYLQPLMCIQIKQDLDLQHQVDKHHFKIYLQVSNKTRIYNPIPPQSFNPNSNNSNNNNNNSSKYSSSKFNKWLAKIQFSNHLKLNHSKFTIAKLVPKCNIHNMLNRRQAQQVGSPQNHIKRKYYNNKSIINKCSKHRFNHNITNNKNLHQKNGREWDHFLV